jgi:hypothetical protein
MSSLASQKCERAISLINSQLENHMKAIPAPPAEPNDYRLWGEKFATTAVRVV